MAEEVKDKYITIQTVAETLSCTEQHIYALIKDGSLQAIKVGSRAVRVSMQSLNDFIDNNTIDPDNYFAPDPDEKDKPSDPPIARSKWMQQK